MSNQSQSNVVDLELIDKVVAIIPSLAWDAVITGVVTQLVDYMPSTILERLTGSRDDYDKAEQILHDYYASDAVENKELIFDACNILGTEATLYFLDSLQLDKYAEFLEKESTTQPE